MSDACGHEEELKVLRAIARLAGEWGLAMAALAMTKTEANRRRAMEVANQMSAALKHYKQFQVEGN